MQKIKRMISRWDGASKENGSNCRLVVGQEVLVGMVAFGN